MKITRIEPFIVHVPLNLPINDSSSHVTHWGVPGVILHTDEGLFGTGTPWRMRPSYFPFTEPSAGVDLGCPFCKRADGTR